MLWLLFLPVTIVFSLVFGLVALPFALLAIPLVFVLWLPFAILRLTLRLILLPIILLVAGLGLLIGALAIVGAVLVPLLPLAFLIVCGWLLWNHTTKTARPTNF